MLETPKERVKLLKDGLSGKRIEELYIKYNNFTIVNGPIICEKVEICGEIDSSITRKQSLRFASCRIPSTG